MTKTNLSVTLLIAMGAIRAQQPTAEEIDRQIEVLRQLKVAQQAAANQQAAQPALRPKKEGTQRIGVTVPAAQLGQGSNVVDMGEPIRQALVQHLSGPAVDVEPLNARILPQAVAEAKQKECDFMLDTSVTRAQKGGGFAKFMGAAGAAQPLIGMIPMAGMVGAAGSAAGAVATVAASATITTLAGAAAGVKAKDEVTVSYRLTGPDQSVLAEGTERLKAQRDGEDVLTPLVARVSTIVAEKVLKPAK